MFCAHLAAQPDFMSPIWEAEWYIILYIYIISYNLGLKFQNPGQNFLLSLSSTTDGFTPELKTNEEQKQACCCVDYFLLTSISLFKKILRYIYFNVDQSFSMATSYSMQDFSWGMQTVRVACRIQFPDQGWKPSPFALGARSLSHQTTRGVLDPLFPDCFPFIPAVLSSLKIINY